jgi:hypothetical protein
MPVMIQQHADGQYGQAQALFDQGRIVAVHTSVLTGQGVGGSAAARLSVDHLLAKDAIARIGTHLGWHGGLTVDYIHQEGILQIIECNPRIVEPGNAAAAGVNFPQLTIDLVLGQPMQGCVHGRSGVRTHSALALTLGAAANTRSRRALLKAATFDGGPCSPHEVLTPIREDPLSAITFGVPLAQVLAWPAAADRLTSTTVDRYAITPVSVDTVRRTQA